jgi:hypothetical protein
MGSKPAVIIGLTLILVVASVVGTSNCFSQPVQQNEGPMFSFTVLLRRMEMQEITADVQIEYLNMPYKLPSTDLAVFVEQAQEYGGGEYNQVEMQQMDPNGQFYRGVKTMNFHPSGNTEFYPLDGYALNFTFTVELPRDLINNTNTKVGIKCLIPGLDEYKEAGTSEDKFDAITESSKEGILLVNLDTKIYLQRGFSTQLVMSVIFISYLLLGSLLLIKPDKLEQRLSACLTLFLFAISFTFTIQVPTALQARATFAETLTFMLLIGAGLLSVLSVIEKTLFEEKPRLEILQYPIEGAVLVLLSFTLHGQISHFIGMSGGYPWLRSLGTTFIAFSAVLIAAILYGYVSKTALFVIRRRKKS